MYRFTPRFQAGLEYNPAASEVNPLFNWTLNPESDKLPMINLGMSSDRIGTPPGPMSYYVTFAKSFPLHKVGCYVSLSYSEFERGFTIPFGASYHFTPEWSTMFMHDGRRSHLLLTHAQADWSVSLMWIWFKHPGISFSFGF